MSELNKEVWVSQLMEKFYPDTSFLNFTRDFSSLVDNDKIHMAEAGIDPVVLVNNTVYPINVDTRVDSPIEIELDKFETENTLVRRPDVIERSYDMLESVLMGHRMSLRSKTAAKAAHAISPFENTDFTPVILASGDMRPPEQGGHKRLIFEDILLLKRRYDDIDVDLDKRFLVLCPAHVEDLMRQDLKSFKDILEMKDGKPSKFASFNILQSTQTARYNSADNKKKAWGSIPLTEDLYSSFSFYGDEVMKAESTPYIYQTIDDPKERGTIVGFDMRFICLPIRNKAIGAIIS